MDDEILDYIKKVSFSRHYQLVFPIGFLILLFLLLLELSPQSFTVSSLGSWARLMFHFLLKIGRG